MWRRSGELPNNINDSDIIADDLLLFTIRGDPEKHGNLFYLGDSGLYFLGHIGDALGSIDGHFLCADSSTASSHADYERSKLEESH